MSEWGLLGGLFDDLVTHLPMLGRFWLLLMLVFRMLILGTVASDLFEDEQEEFVCNTLQPGCKQVCYDIAFPISQYRFWVFHIVLIATPSLLFVVYATHPNNKKNTRSKFSQSSSQDYREDLRLKRLYITNVCFRILAEVGFLLGQYLLYGFKVQAQFSCTRFPCPHTVDCFTSRPAEKTIFLCFYFAVGVISAVSSCAELVYSSVKWFGSGNNYNFQYTMSEVPEVNMVTVTKASRMRVKRSSVRSSSSGKSIGKKKNTKSVANKSLLV